MFSFFNKKAPLPGAFLLLETFFPRKTLRQSLASSTAQFTPRPPGSVMASFANLHQSVLQSFYKFTEPALVLLTFPHPQYIVDTERISHHIWIYSRFSRLDAMKG